MGDREFYQPVLEKFASSANFQKLAQLAGKNKATITGLNNFGRSLVLAALVSTQEKPVVFVTKSEQEQFRIQKLLEELWDIKSAIYPPLRNITINRQEFIANFKRRIHISQQLKKLGNVTIFTGSNLIEPLSTPATSVQLQVGEEVSLIQLIGELAGIGFERQTKVFQAGEIAARGEIIDIFPIDAESPWRIVLSGNKIEQILSFNPLNNKKLETLQSIRVAAVKNKSFAPNLVEYLEQSKDELIVVLDHTEDIMQSLYEMFVASESAKLATINKALDAIPLIKIEAIASGDVKPSGGSTMCRVTARSCVPPSTSKSWMRRLFGRR